MGHGQVSDKAILEKHCGHYKQTGGTDRRRSQDQVNHLQQSQGQPAKSREEADVNFFKLYIFHSIVLSVIFSTLSFFCRAEEAC